MKKISRYKITLLVLIYFLIFSACNLSQLEAPTGDNSRRQENQVENEEDQEVVEEENENNEAAQNSPEDQTEPEEEQVENEQVRSPTEKEEEEEEQDKQPTPTPELTERGVSGGPWFLASTPSGLYLLNMDGSGLTQLSTDIPHEFHSLDEGVSDSGGRIAYLTGTNTYQNLVLHVIDIPNGMDHQTIDLLSYNQVDDEAPRALVEQTSFAWSNDGEQLAFFAAIDGPSSDLYVYDAVSGGITRLSSGPSQAYQPVWSPDDEYIVHVGAESFGTGAGYSMAGVWAASADGSGMITLPLPADSADEIILGWRDNDTFVSYSWNAFQEAHNLRFTNIQVGIAQEIWEYPFTSVGFGGSDYPWLLLSIDEFRAGENPAGLMGTYFLEPPDFSVWPLFEGSPGYIQPIGNSAFVVNLGTSSQLIETNMVTDITHMDGVRIFSDNGDPAWYSEFGLWIQANGQAVQVTDLPVELAAWGADGQSILFSFYGDLFAATAPNWEPIPVASAFFPEQIVVVIP